MKNDSYSHIATLTKWIEQNLRSDLNMDQICRKSGYSHRHLQRIFRLETGMTLANYINQRRLYKAAIALKTTLSSIEEIALRYNFKTTGSFARSFNRVFGLSPKKFRASNKLNLKMLPSIPMDAENPLNLKYSYVHFDGLELFGLKTKFKIHPDELDSDQILHRAELETKFSYLTQGKFNEAYGLVEYSCDQDSPDYVEIDYSIGVKNENLVNEACFSQLPLIFGDYIMASCENVKVPFFRVCEKAYWDIILSTGITRRKGREIERIVWRNHVNTNRTDIDYHFMIPIVFDEKVHELLTSSDDFKLY